jgi:hypothetical protein
VLACNIEGASGVPGIVRVDAIDTGDGFVNRRK